jgi:hypothetical protein
MKSLDELAASLQSFGKRLSHEGWRTATLAKLRLDLKGLDIQRKEALRRLGEKVYEMKRRKSIKDDFLMENLIGHFEEIETLEKRSLGVLEDIQRITLEDHKIPEEDRKEPIPKETSTEIVKKDECETPHAFNVQPENQSENAGDRMQNIKGINE